jgi:MscS family membrane protein
MKTLKPLHIAVSFFLFVAYAQTPPSERAAPSQTALPPTPAFLATQSPPPRPPPEDPLDRLTPYGCVRGFLLAANRGNYEQASEYLDVLTTPARGQELAKQLEAVLNGAISANLDHLSRNQEGNLKDGLPQDRDRAAQAKTNSGTHGIFLDRVHRANEPAIWLFSSETIHTIPDIYAEIGEPPLARFFPDPLLNIRVFSLPLWRWVMIVASLALAMSLASWVARGLIPLLRPIFRRITGEELDQRITSLKGPIRLILLAIAVRLLGIFAMSLLGRQFWTNTSGVIAVLGFGWFASQFSNIVSDLTSRKLLRRQMPGKLAIVALARRLFKILVILVIAIILLRDAGVNVTAMLAGLGVGGVALALAAQKTLENLFGGISLIMREAIRVGDFCKVADQTGTVEDIGLGSTRLRTLDRTLVSVPNAQISQMNLENISLRDKFWLHHTLELRRDTSPDQMRYVLGNIEKLLRSHPKVEPDSARIQFLQFGSSSLDAEIFAYVRGGDYVEFLKLQQDLLLQVMDIVAASGTSIAVPAQMNYSANGYPEKSGQQERPKEAPAASKQ